MSTGAVMAMERASRGAHVGAGDRVDLRALVDAHRASSHPLRIESVLGDGVLLDRLPALARMREQITTRGYRFVSLAELPDIYTVLPLVLLPEILDERTIPYRANAPALVALAESCPEGVFDEITFEDISPLGLVHHESGHALYFELVRELETPGFRARGNASGTRAARRLVETLIESEGFALGLDIFGALFAYADESRTTKQLRSINAPPHQLADYERQNPGGVARLVAFARRYPRAALKLLAAGAFIANLRPRATNRVAPPLAARLFAFVGLPAGEEAVGCELLSMGLTIDYAFRQRLAPTLFRYLGIERDFHEVLATPLDTALASGGAFDTNVERAIAALGLAAS